MNYPAVLICCLTGLFFSFGLPFQSMAQNGDAPGTLIRSLPSAAPYENELNQVREMIRMGRYSQALEQLDILIQQAPEMAQVRFLKGVALAERGQINQAIAEFRFLATTYPFLPEPFNNLAVLYTHQKQYDLARETLLKAIETHTSYATAYQNLSNIYAMMAGAAYDKALGLKADKQQQPDLQLLSNLHSADFIKAEEAVVASVEMPTDRPAQPVEREPEPEQQAVPVAEPPVVPAAEPVPEQPDAVEENADIAAFIDTWKTAWSAQDVPAYLRCYGANFRLPARYKTRAAWEKARRWVISRPASIDVVVQNLNITREGENRASATFRQVYRSDRYQDQVQKTLSLQKVGAGWKIVDETSVEL